MSEVEKILQGNEIIGAVPFLYEKLEINKQYILTGGTNFEELQKAFLEKGFDVFSDACMLKEKVTSVDSKENAEQVETE